MPLKTAVDTKRVQYYKHLINLENKLVHQVLQLDRQMYENQCSDTFTGYINALSNDIGMPMQGSKGIESYSKAKVKHMIYYHYQKIWKLRLNLNPKARFYHSFKVVIKLESYLNIIRDRSLRVLLQIKSS